MPRYLVNVTSPDGSLTTIEREFESMQRLYDTLQAEGFAVLGVEALEVVEKLEDLPSQTREVRSSSATLTTEEAHDFAHHLAGLSRAGLPLPDGLRALQEELPQGTLSRLVGEVAKRLERGESLEATLEDLGRSFPGHLRGLILAGSRSGRLETVLSEFVNYSQVGASLRRAVWLSLAYPIMMITIYATIFAFLSFVVVKGFEAIFKDFGIPLPGMTVLLLSSSRAIVDAGWTTLVGPVVAIAAIVVAGRFLLEPSARYRIVHLLPVFGPLSRWTSMAEFAHYLGLLLECDIPISTALPLAAEGARDEGLLHVSREVARDVEGGQPLADAFSSWNVFPRGFSKLLRWAEGHQSLPETLHMTAEMLQARAQAHAAFISSVCGIVSVVVILWGCAFVVIALFYPLFTLIARLS